MNPSRHSRHLVLDGIGERGIHAQSEAHLLIIGCGGLGQPVAMALGAASVGHITLVDNDTLQPTNLARLPPMAAVDVGKPKAALLAEMIHRNHPDQHITVLDTTVTPANLPALLEHVDIVVDASDNWPTRKAIAQTCRHAGLPLISGGALGTDGWAGVFLPAGTPLETWLKQPEQMGDTCESVGILSPLVGFIGNLMAMEALKLVWQRANPTEWSVLESKVFYMDARRGTCLIMDMAAR